MFGDGDFQTALDDHITYLSNYLDEKRGVSQGYLVRSSLGEVISRVGRQSNHAQWYRDFYKEHKRAPRKKDLHELALRHLTDGFYDDFGFIPPFKVVQDG